jgi:hypothetical protein
MMISGLGSNSGDVANTQIRTDTGNSSGTDSKGTDSISLTMSSIVSVSDGAGKYAEGSNAILLFSKLNAGVLYAGDLSGVQSAIDTYTQSLPSSNVYMSPYTAPFCPVP